MGVQKSQVVDDFWGRRRPGAWFLWQWCSAPRTHVLGPLGGAIARLKSCKDVVSGMASFVECGAMWTSFFLRSHKLFAISLLCLISVLTLRFLGSTPPSSANVVAKVGRWLGSSGVDIACEPCGWLQNQITPPELAGRYQLLAGAANNCSTKGNAHPSPALFQIPTTSGVSPSWSRAKGFAPASSKSWRISTLLRHGSKVERCLAERVLCVDVGLGHQDCFGNEWLSNQRCQMQCGPAIASSSVWICEAFEQQADASGAAHSDCCR